MSPKAKTTITGTDRLELALGEEREKVKRLREAIEKTLFRAKAWNIGIDVNLGAILRQALAETEEAGK